MGYTGGSAWSEEFWGFNIFKPIDLVGFYIRIVYCILYEINVEGQDSDVIRRDRAFDQIGQEG